MTVQPVIKSTRPTLGRPFAAITSSLVVAGVAGAGAWVVAYGLPTGETASWWVLGATGLLLAVVVATWNRIDTRRMSLLQKCLIVSVLLHVLIAAAFSVVVVARQIVELATREEPMTPTVNLNLSREIDVRESVRQQATLAPPVLPTPVPTFTRLPTESPLPPMSDRVEPVGVPGLELRQVASMQHPVAPTIPMAPPAAELTMPLLPVRPDITPMPETTRLPGPAGDAAKELTHLPGPVSQQLALATSPIKGSGPGSLGAPPSMLPLGNAGGGTATGSGTGRALSLLSTAAPPRLIDPPVPLIAPPAPSMPEVTLSRGADPLPVRAFDQRQGLIQKYGGSPETEAAVSRALLYLSRHQHPDGHWTKIIGDKDKPTDSHDMALTALAVMCYLGADHTHEKEGPYRETVRKGLSYLLTAQKGNGDLRGGGNMYDHGIAALALGEAAAMTRDRNLRAAAHRAAQFILDAQNRAGAWRYEPRDLFTDTSVTGWQVLALHSAERTGFRVPDSAKLDVIGFLGTTASGRHGMLASYLSVPNAPTTTMTAEATFTRMLLGQALSREQLAEAADFMVRKLPTRENLNYYYIYYASLAMMQMQGDSWRIWNAATSRLLLDLQERRGDDAGSFPVEGEWANRGGKIYTTAMSTLTLEVYYRYLPMYAPKP